MTDWGSVPAWLGLAGAAVAVLAYLAGRRDAARTHAAAVYAVITGSRQMPDASVTEDNRRFTKVVVHNDGDLPALDVSPSVWEWGRRRWTWRFRRHTDWWTGKRVQGIVYATIAPHSTGAEHEFLGIGLPPRGQPDTVRPPVVLVFLDGNGRRWVRWPDGRLHRIWPGFRRG